MDENIREIEKSMSTIDMRMNSLKDKIGKDDDFISLSKEINNLDLLLDKTLKPMNYERRIKILD
ncbi:MAG: hypothetical protein IJ593_00280 [Lachnospiraceae bacterium]|nr:hypothetical protein [Lachnospiraceae bacterium]